mmetsp:Transcript_35611/g.70410  ORF Transcript_35611/g.70410 Transcript_35611/m.70410 type:complete len:665 (-) Transcript_35611:127-2121(-)
MAESQLPCLLSNATLDDSSVRVALKTEVNHSLKDFILKHACLIEELFKRMQRVETALRLHGGQDVVALGSQQIHLKAPHILREQWQQQQCQQHQQQQQQQQETANGPLPYASVHPQTARHFTPPPRLIGLGVPAPVVHSQSGPPPVPPGTSQQSACTTKEASPQKSDNLVVPQAITSARGSRANLRAVTPLKRGGKLGSLSASKISSSASVTASRLPSPAQRQPSPLRSVKAQPCDVGGRSEKAHTPRSRSQPVASTCTNISAGVQLWEVVYSSGVNIRLAKDPSSLVIGCKPAGSIVCGRQEGDWLALAGEPGFMMLSSGATCLLRQVPAKLHVASGNVPSPCSPSKSVASSPSRPKHLRCIAMSTGLSARELRRSSVTSTASIRSSSAPLHPATANQASPHAAVAPAAVHVSVQHGRSSRLEYDVPDATGVRSLSIEVVDGKLVHSSKQGGQVLVREVTRLTWCPMSDGSVVALDQLEGAWPVPALHTGTFKSLANSARVPIRLGEAAPASAFTPEGVAPPVIPEGTATFAPPTSLNALIGLSPGRKSGVRHANLATTAPNACASMLGPATPVATSQSEAHARMHTTTESQSQLLESNNTGATQLRSSELGGSWGVGSLRSPVVPLASDGASEGVPSLSQRAPDSEAINSVPSPSGSARLGA